MTRPITPSTCGHIRHALSAAMRQLMFVTMVAAFTVTGCGGPSGEVRDLNARGLAEYRAGRYTDAIAMFKKAAEKDRERPEASVYIADCYLAMSQERFKDGNIHGALRWCDIAIAKYDAAVGAFPGYSRAVQGKADALKLKGEHEQALQTADWAAKNSGLQSTKLILKGREYAQESDMDQAQLAFRQAVAVEPNNAAAHAELGLFYLRCGNKTEARESLRRAYELDRDTPGVTEALAQLGDASVRD